MIHVEDIPDDTIQMLYEEALADLTLVGKKGDDFAKGNHREFLIFCRSGAGIPEHDDAVRAKTFLIKKKTYVRYMKLKKDNDIILATFADHLLNLGMDAYKYNMKEWLTTKRIEEQDRIEREAHNAS